MGVVQFEVYLISLDPTVDAEIRKTRPCLVISPDELNRRLLTVIVAPMTTVTRGYPSRVNCSFKGKLGQIVLDQIRTVDRTRLIKRLGKLDKRISVKVLEILREMFAS